MQYCGLDMGKKSSHFCIVNESRAILKEGKVRNKPEALQKTLGRLEPMRIVIEASTKSFWMADQLSALGHEPVIVNPGRTKAIGSSLIKNDKLDARVLATLNAADLLARVAHVSFVERMGRLPVAVRDGLVESRVKLMNTTRSLLDAEGVDVPSSSAAGFTATVRAVLEVVPAALADAVQALLEAVDALSEKIRTCDTRIEAKVRSDPQAQRLMTAPGVGPIVVSYFMNEVRDPTRFANGRQVGAYFGLVPSLYESGKTSRRGRVTKQGHRKTRWALTVAANALLRTRRPSLIRDWGLALVQRLGRKKAIVAVARKLASVLWSMWKNERDFCPMFAAI